MISSTMVRCRPVAQDQPPAPLDPVVSFRHGTWQAVASPLKTTDLQGGSCLTKTFLVSVHATPFGEALRPSSALHPTDRRTPSQYFSDDADNIYNL